jgi:hypothetical protein|nr:MAG TPA: hypothetical protein [Caudoviricetes sp.]
MAKHPHAELMAKYAKDAIETDEPWKRWEVRIAANVQPNAVFEGLSFHPQWDINNEYRRKPELIKAGIYEFPKPEVNSLKIDDKYWYVEISDYGLYAQYETWTCSNKDYQLLNSLLMHTNREDAQQHADVLNKIHRIK